MSTDNDTNRKRIVSPDKGRIAHVASVKTATFIMTEAKRYRFFGTSWWLSALQVVGSGALVFVVAMIIDNT